ncbi:hypothetical protein F4776DRAFT_599714 [Hypoxylon sp. NC0597]|nr:hypothetical protein F4776DRAFT_599714 [Hypoxylon sp. NC0597]
MWYVSMNAQTHVETQPRQTKHVSLCVAVKPGCFSTAVNFGSMMRPSSLGSATGFLNFPLWASCKGNSKLDTYQAFSVTVTLHGQDLLLMSLAARAK